MDKKKGLLNVSVSIIFRLLTVGMSIVVRRQLILFCGNDVNGLNSLYLSIIGFLAVAELGVGSAITFCMYRPIVEGDDEKVSALYQLFRKWYLAVGAVMLVCGLALTPFLHLFAKDYAKLDVNLYSTFLLMLISVVITYLFGAKTALINAYKNNYITTAINSGGILLQYVLQLLVLHAAGSFTGYLLCRIMAALLQWAVTEWFARKKHGNIIKVRAKLNPELIQELSEKVRAMFMHKIGSLLVNTVDSIVISAFVGVVALGEYANYTAIQSSMDSVIRLVFASLSSVVGHMYAEKGAKQTQKYHEMFHMVNFMVGIVFYLGYFAVIDALIALLFGEGLVVVRSISAVIAMNGFVQFMRNCTMTFREATGTFYNDRWKPLVEGIVNIVLSVVLVNRIGVVGVIAATILTNLLICHVVEPYVLYRHAFHAFPWKYYAQNYGMILLFGCAMILFQLIEINGYDHWHSFFLNGMLSVVISLGFCILALLLNGRIRNMLIRRIKNGTTD